MKIEVTEKHIQSGHRGLGSECPIALAIREVIPDTHVFVTHSSITVGSLRFPNNYSVFTRNYDNHREVYPFTFHLSLTEE